MSSGEQRSQDRRARRRTRQDERRARNIQLHNQLRDARDAHLIDKARELEEKYADQLPALKDAGHLK